MSDGLLAGPSQCFYLGLLQNSFDWYADRAGSTGTLPLVPEFMDFTLGKTVFVAAKQFEPFSCQSTQEVSPLSPRLHGM